MLAKIQSDLVVFGFKCPQRQNTSLKRVKLFKVFRIFLNIQSKYWKYQPFQYQQILSERSYLLAFFRPLLQWDNHKSKDNTKTLMPYNCSCSHIQFFFIEIVYRVICCWAANELSENGLFLLTPRCFISTNQIAI